MGRAANGPSGGIRGYNRLAAKGLGETPSRSAGGALLVTSREASIRLQFGQLLADGFCVAGRLDKLL